MKFRNSIKPCGHSICVIQQAHANRAKQFAKIMRALNLVAQLRVTVRHFQCLMKNEQMAKAVDGGQSIFCDGCDFSMFNINKLTTV